MKISEIIVEDATTTPGGVGSATKMFLEAEDEPSIREYTDSYGRKRWEVLDWRGVRKIAFDSRGRAHEYLNKNKDDLSHPDGPLKESSDTVWMIEYIPDSEKRKEAINRQTKRLFYKNEEDAQVAFSKLSKSTHDLISRMPMQISARGVPQQWIR